MLPVIHKVIKVSPIMEFEYGFMTLFFLYSHKLGSIS